MFDRFLRKMIPGHKQRKNDWEDYRRIGAKKRQRFNTCTLPLVEERRREGNLVGEWNEEVITNGGKELKERRDE